MTIKELKARRDALHDQLNPLMEQENTLRAEIKDINAQLFQLEMKPVMYKLEADISAGLFEGEELKAKQQKLDNLKQLIK